MFWSQKVCRSDDFLLRSTENSGGRGNPLFATGANAFRTTNFLSRLAMRGAEFHGNTGHDSTTCILSIDPSPAVVAHALFPADFCIFSHIFGGMDGGGGGPDVTCRFKEMAMSPVINEKTLSLVSL